MMEDHDGHLREIFENSPIGILFYDKDGELVDVNQSALNIVRVSEFNDIKGINLFVNPDIESRKEELLKNGFIKFQSSRDLDKTKEYGVYAPTGSGIIYIDYTVSVTDSGFLMQIQDITEYIKAVKALGESEEKLRSLFENISVGISVLDKERNVIYENSALEDILGLTKEDLKQGKYAKRRYLKSNMTEFSLDEFPSARAFNEQKPVKDVEIGVLKEDNSIIWTNVSAIPLPFPDWNTLVITFDITKRKKIEQELKKAYDTLEEKVEKRTVELQTERDNLSSILNTTKSGVYIVNSDYELEYVNPMIEKDFGFIKGQKCYEYFYNEQNVCSNCKIQKAFEGNIIEWEQHSSKSGKIYDAVATPIIRVDGSISVVVFLYDVTRRDKAENQLREMVEELERSNKELQSFAYITSHDLQEPLRTMGSYAGLLKKRYGGQLDKDADDFLDYMVKGAQRMKDMIQGLLEYSRVGTQENEFEEFNSEKALKNALNNLQSTIEEYNAEVTYDKLPNVIADKDQIARIFQNLIGNSLKFRREGVKPKIHISCRKEDNGYVFSVSDNGIGLEEQYSDKIFEVFKRLHAIGEYQGVGIGLSIVKRIIERHSGRIWVESEYGRGSTFYFTIPFQHQS